jgi:hypothetical protein
MNNKNCVCIPILISSLILLYLSGCGGPSPYKNEYLYAAQELEAGLKENPNPSNKQEIKNRIDKLYKLHYHMLELENYNKQNPIP